MSEAGEQLLISLPSSSGIATYPAGATFGPRRMREYEFVWMLQGNAQYRSGSTLVEAPAGSIVLCRSGTTDAFEWDPARRTRHAFFHFQIECTPQSWPPPKRWPLVRPSSDGDVLQPLFRFLLTWLGRGQEYSCQRALELLLHTFVNGNSSTIDAAPENLPEAVERALQFLHVRLESEPAKAITLADLARAACVTPEHLCRVFKESTGHSPLATARLARLDRASTLLARSNYSIGEIATMYGFASPFHFSRKFKEVYGRSPRELRQAVRAGSSPPLSRLLLTRQLPPASTSDSHKKTAR